MRFRIGLAVALLAALPSLASASVFYRFAIVAQTGTGGIMSLGTGPSVNEKGKVAYIGRTTTSTIGSATVYAWSPVGGSVDISPGFASPNRNFGEAVRMNRHDEVATWNRNQPSNLYEIRVFRANTPNQSSVMVRGQSGTQPYDLLFQNPAMNASQVLEDRSNALAGDKDGVCDPGETCVSQIAFGGFRAADSPPRYLGTVVQNPTQASDQGVQTELALHTASAKPAMADDGRIAVRGPAASDPIQLFNYNLVGSAIAGASDGFTALGVAPGITPDGKIVAFAGNRGEGDGIFLSQELPSGQRRIVRIAGENLVVQKAELGHSATNSKLYFSTIELDSRVGIAYTPGRTGVADGAVVVTFIGTPNGASRTNAGTGKPYLFSAQKGLWALRIELDAPLYEQVCAVRAPGVTGNVFTPSADDVVQVANGVAFLHPGPNGICESGNLHDVETLFSRAGPLPVVQIGDRILADTVAGIAVHDPVAPANVDDVGSARVARLGDHRVAFWADVGGGKQLIVRGDHLDSDQDGLMDHWETTGLDLEGTGAIDLDLAGMGANPFVRDFFVQIDFTADRPGPLNLGAKHRPIPGVIRQLAQFYAGAPAMPNGVPAGIRLHVDAGTGMDRAGQNYSRNMGVGPLRGGALVSPTPIDIIHYGLPGSVTLPGVTARDFDTIKQNTLRSSHRGAREFVFTHIIWADFHHGVPDSVTPITGTATGGGNFTLSDANNPALASGLGGHGILITGGTGAGQLRDISSSGFYPGNPTPVAVVQDAWTVNPDATSTYVILNGSGGESQPGDRLDGAFGPGKNFSLTLGAFGRDPVGNEQADFADQWKTLAHEIGHNQTLMHGGNNHNNYKANYVSLMNYAYELCTTGVGTDANGAPLTGAAPCPVDDYAPPSSPVRDDWGTLDLASALNPSRTGQAFSVAPDLANVPFPSLDPAWTPFEIRVQHGPRDTTAPLVAVTSPPSGTAIATGNGIAVSFTATDNVRVVRAEVLFDVNGNGEVDEPAEVFAATSAGGANFTANVPAIAGPSGTRSLTVYAFDQNGTPGTAYVRINVGSVAPLVVPSVIGAQEQVAREALLAAQLEPGLTTYQQSAAVAGAVISQNPAAGQSRPPGTAVALVISLGASGATVPNVTGLSQSQATAVLAAAGFSATTTPALAGSGLPANSVAGQAPVGGRVALAGSAVELLVVPGAGISVPNVVGLTQAGATSTIQGAGLVVGTTTQQFSPTVPAGSVISQNPVSGTVAVAGSAVHYVVSLGASGVNVPNVVGQTRSVATAAITGASLVVGAVGYQPSATVPAGSVSAQNPAGGSPVGVGSAVALTVSSGPVCGGFADQDPASPFCPNIEWIRNRGITLGCPASAPSYCPGDGVTRLQMAAFMNRLGTAMTTTPVLVEASGLAFDPATPQVVCASNAFAVTAFPRRAHVDAIVGIAAIAATGLLVEPVASVDGTTWLPLNAQPHRMLASPGEWNHSRVLSHRDLDLGESVRFGVRVSRGGLSGAGTVVDGTCRLRVRIDNRNPLAAPFDLD